jgi:putative PIN family toxin of toxin-antitoxin system
VVLDTNVLLSGVFTRGVCEAILDVCLAEPQYTIVGSEFILDEFVRHAGAEFGAPDSEIRRVVKLFRDQMELVEPARVPSGACRDANDLQILGTMLAGKVNYLVSEDRDFLEIRRFHSIPILSPRAFHERLR